MLIYILYNFKGDFMNLKWNINNMYSEIDKLKKKFLNINDENKKCIICRDIHAYMVLLNSIDVNIPDLKDIDLKKYENIYNRNFEFEKNKLIEKIYNNYDKFSQLINNINNMNVSLDNTIPKNNFIIDSKSLDYLKKFLSKYDKKLLNYFEYMYNNDYININLKEDAFYQGYCTNICINKKSYIDIIFSSPYYILPALIHEYGHAYENLISKHDAAWLYNVNIYAEVFAIYFGLSFDDFILDTNYCNQGNYNIFDLVKTTFILSNDLKKYFTDFKFDNYDDITDFIYFYDVNIALAFFEQYKIDKKSCKKNVNYFIRNNDILFSDALLKSVDIDLNRLYSGDYYKEFCQSYKSVR